MNNDAHSTPVICAYYTDNYRKEIETLKESLEKFGIYYYIKRFESRGYWEANTRIKPEFLLDCLDRFTGKPIVYLDADAVVRMPLSLFETIEADIGVFHSPTAKGFSHRYLTGTLYLANNQKIRHFVKDWIDFQKGALLGVDQDSFEQAMAKNSELIVVDLPESYVKIFDRVGVEAVIEHFQASRNRVKLQRFLKKFRNVMIIVTSLLLALWLIYHWIVPLK